MDPGRGGGVYPPLPLPRVAPGAVAIGHHPCHVEAEAGIESLRVLAGAERDVRDRRIRFGLAQACQRQLAADALPVQRALDHAPAEAGAATATACDAAARDDAAVALDDLEGKVHRLHEQDRKRSKSLRSSAAKNVGTLLSKIDRQALASVGR